MKSVFKIIFIIGISVISFLNANAQSTVWRQILEGPYNELGYDVIELRDKGYLMVGTKEILVSGTSFLTIQSYLVRLDKMGNILWQKTIGDSIYPNTAVSVIEDPDGNIYLPYNSDYAHLIKMNSTGSILWDKDYPSSKIAAFSGISFTDNFKNFMLVGQNEISNITTSSLTKLDTSGNLIWNRMYYDSIPSLSVYSSTGYCFLFLENFYYLTGGKGVNGFIIKTDTSGNIIWNKRYLQAQYIYKIAINSDNSFIATGLARSYGTYCFKFDGNGDTIWTKDFGLDPQNYYGEFKIVKTYDGNFALGTGGPKIGIMDSLGIIKAVYMNSYPENITVSQWNLNSTSDSGFIVTGSYGYPPSNMNSNTRLHDAIIFKVDKFGNMVSIKNQTNELTESFKLYQNYPNPFNPITKLEFGIPASRGESKLPATRSGGFVSLKIYDVLGNEVRTLVNENKPAGSYEVEFDGNNLPSGVYFYSLLIDGNVMDTKRMVLLK